MAAAEARRAIMVGKREGTRRHRGRPRCAAHAIGGLLLLLLAGLLPATALALDDREPAPDAGLEELLEVLEQQTRLATNTRLNVDRVPGMLTVLQGEDMLERGARTVFEALELVPGVQTSITGSGTRQVVVRGVGKVSRSGKTKILLNGVPVASTISAEAVMIFALPIEQVERIEVVRGPGSAVHGEHAYVGVINVLTRDDAPEAFARADEYGGVTGGAAYAYESPERQLKVSLNVAGMGTDGPDVRSGPDALAGSDVSNAPGPTNENEDLLAAFGTLEYRASRLRFQFVRNRLGDYFGAAGILPDPADRSANEEQVWTITGEQDLTLGPHLEALFRVGASNYSSDLNFQILPSGFTAGTAEFPDGVFFGIHYPEELRLSADSELHYTGFRRHRLMLGLSASHTDADDFYRRQNFDPDTFEPLGENSKLTGEDNFLDEGDTSRSIGSVVVQDEITVLDSLTLTAGARFDSYSDVGENVSPRIAVVYRPFAHHSVKAQYAEAFRPPTFLEASSATATLDPETVRTVEAAYIYNASASVARVTLFHSWLYDLIGPRGLLFENQGEARVRGVEVDFEHDLTRWLGVDGNVSFADGEDDAGSAFVDVAEWTGTAGLRLEPWRGYMLALQYRYVGPRERAATDPRDDLESQHAFDLTATAHDVATPGLTLRLGLRNLLDENLELPAPAGTYPEDFRRPGRELWGGVRYVW